MLFTPINYMFMRLFVIFLQSGHLEGIKENHKKLLKKCVSVKKNIKMETAGQQVAPIHLFHNYLTSHILSPLNLVHMKNCYWSLCLCALFLLCMGMFNLTRIGFIIS